MRRLSTICFLAILLILNSFIVKAQDQSCAQIKVYRPPQLAQSLIAVRVFVNDVEVVSLVNNSSVTINLKEPGEYSVALQPKGRGLLFKLRAKKTFQVQCNEEVYVKVVGGSALPETMIVLKDVQEGGAEFNEMPLESSLTLDFTGNAVPVLAAIPNNSPALKTPTENTAVAPTTAVVSQTATRTTGSTSQPSAHSLNGQGKSYALIIGVNDYNDYRINDLDEPIQDAQELYNVLVSEYTFDKQNVKFLKNPTKDEITLNLDHFYKTLSQNDELLIFYAGHGYWDEKFQQGYWITTDAEQDNRGTWLSNGTIRDYMRAIPTKHSLLITDACFGGGIFKSRAAFANSSVAINQLYELPSRKAMTSGAMSEVPDKSVFIEYLVKRLKQNQEKYLSSEQLFASFKIAVINNSANGQVPQYGEVKETGDEGGDFIFIRR